MENEVVRDPSTYTGSVTEIGMQEARSLSLNSILGLDNPALTDTSDSTIADDKPYRTVVAPVVDENDETSGGEPEDDDTPWSKTEETKLEEEDDPVVLKSEDPDYLKQKAINESWKAKRIEKELRKAKEELQQLRSGAPAAQPAQHVPAPTITVTPEIPQHIRARIKDDIDHVIFSDPEMIELANKEALLRASSDKFETVGDYAAALTDIQTEFRAKHLAARQYIQQHNEQIRQQEGAQVAQIMDNFASKVAAAKDKYPQVEKAVDHLTKNADKLHVEVRKALLTDENAGELAWLLGSSKKAMDMLIKSSEVAARTKTIPTEALMYIGELRGRIRAGTAESVQTTAESTVRRPAVPKTLKASQGSGSEAPADLMKWGKQAREGKVKLPWQ